MRESCTGKKIDKGKSEERIIHEGTSIDIGGENEAEKNRKKLKQRSYKERAA